MGGGGGGRERAATWLCGPDSNLTNWYAFHWVGGDSRKGSSTTPCFPLARAQAGQADGPHLAAKKERSGHSEAKRRRQRLRLLTEYIPSAPCAPKSTTEKNDNKKKQSRADTTQVCHAEDGGPIKPHMAAESAQIAFFGIGMHLRDSCTHVPETQGYSTGRACPDGNS